MCIRDRRTAAVNLVRQMFEENPEYASVLFKTGIRKGSAVPESTIAAAVSYTHLAETVMVY